MVTLYKMECNMYPDISLSQESTKTIFKAKSCSSKNGILTSVAHIHLGDLTLLAVERDLI